MARLQTDHTAGLAPIELVPARTPTPDTDAAGSPSFDSHLRQAASSPEEPPPHQSSETDTVDSARPRDSETESAPDGKPDEPAVDEPSGQDADPANEENEALTADFPGELPETMIQAELLQKTVDTGGNPADPAVEQLAATKAENGPAAPRLPNAANLDVEAAPVVETSETNEPASGLQTVVVDAPDEVEPTVTPQSSESSDTQMAPTKPGQKTSNADAAPRESTTTATDTPNTASTTGTSSAEPVERDPAAFSAPQQSAEAEVPEVSAAADKTDVRGSTAEPQTTADSSRTQPVGSAKELTTPQAAENTSADPASRTEQAQQTRFVQRVARAFASVGDRGGSVRIRLNPPELGSLQLEITIRNGAMIARVEAETGTARNMLLDNLPALRDRLAQHDVKVERFEVDISDGSERDPSPKPDDQQGEDDHYKHPSGASAKRDDSDAEEQAARHTRNRVDLSNRLDVII